MLTLQPSIAHDSECSPFEGVQLSAQEFYNKLKSEIEGRSMPDVTCRRVTFSEGGLLSHNREYLRVSRKELIFDICAAPFGTPCYISWHLGENAGFIRSLLQRLPFIGRFFKKELIVKNYYQLDSECAFIFIVKNCINAAIEELNIPHGLRGPAELKKRSSGLLVN